MINYREYMSSAAWYRKREQRRIIDNNQCQTCLSSDNLECHHRTYIRLGNENVETDLIMLCAECHEAVTSVIRRRRYQNRQHKVGLIEPEENHYVARERVQIEVERIASDAQRKVGRPKQRNRKGYEDYFGQASEN